MVIRIRFEYTRYAHWGGQSGYHQFIRHLDPQRFNTHEHAASLGDADLAWLRPLWRIIKAGLRRGRVPWYSLSDLNAELFAITACLAGRVDIVHFLDGDHSPQFLPRFVRNLRLSRVRTVVTFHQPARILPKIIDGNLLQWIDQVVLVSPSQLPFFRQYVPDDRLHVILHGVDIEFFRPPELPPEERPFRCITVGHWFREWTVLRAIVDALPEITFDVVTGAETGLSHSPNLHVHRGIADAELAGLYRRANVLLLPLADATANNALLEGMASGLPVVATDLHSMRAYVPKQAGILVIDNSVSRFVTAIRSLQRDSQLREAMGRSARVRAEELSWPRLVLKYEALYQKALTRKPIEPCQSSHL